MRNLAKDPGGYLLEEIVERITKYMMINWKVLHFILRVGTSKTRFCKLINLMSEFSEFLKILFFFSSLSLISLTLLQEAIDHAKIELISCSKTPKEKKMPQPI